MAVVSYCTEFTLKGKKKELLRVLKYLNNYNKNNEKVYLKFMSVLFESKNLPEGFDKSFDINDCIPSISDEEIEKKLKSLDDNEEYTVYIGATGPYGRFATIEDIGFFENLADISQDVTFKGEISGGDLIVDDCIEGDFDGKILHINSLMYYEDMQYIYFKELEKQLPYEKFCDLFIN